jgi:hypothetical protein
VAKVLVGKKTEGKSFTGYWAEFEGKQVSSYEDPGLGKSIAYTLYKCTGTAYNFDAYRVHVADESSPENPVYELHPHDEYPDIRGVGQDYSETYTKDGLAADYPVFLKDIDYFRERHIDPA